MSIIRLPKGLGLSRRLDSALNAMPEGLQGVFKPAHDWVQRQASIIRINNEVDDAADQVKFASRLARGPKIFVDCGMNDGRVMRRFMRDLPGFQFHGFEMNTQFRQAAERLKRENPHFLSANFAAVSTHDGEATFVLRGKPNSVNPFDGSTLVDDKITGEASELFTTPTVDMSRWLKKIVAENTKREDIRPFVAMKMDIEGAEFDVLEHMLQRQPGRDGRLQSPAAVDIDVLIVEFHAEHMELTKRPEYRQRRADILRGMHNNGVLVHEWI